MTSPDNISKDGKGARRRAPHSPSPIENAPSRSNPRKQRSGRRRVFRWIVGVLGVLVALPLLFILLLLLIAQTNWGAAKIGDAVIGLANPFDETTITVANIDGNWVSRLELHDLALTRDDAVRMVHIDTLRVRYNLLGLLRGKLHVREASLAAPTVVMQQQGDTTWDLLNAFGSDTTATDSASTSFTFQIDQLRLNKGAFAAHFYAPQGDSTWTIQHLHLRARDISLAKTIALTLDALGASLLPPDHAAPITLHTQARLFDGQVILDTLRLDAPGSAVASRGRLHLPDDTHDAIYDIDVLLDAGPLALHDLHPFLPTVDTTGSIDLDLRARGTAELLDVVAEAHLSDGARLSLDLEATPSIEGKLTYRMDGRLRGFDPGVFTGNPATSGHVNADLQADLHGPALDSLSGTLRADVFDTHLGDYAPDRTTLHATFDDGEATFDLATGLREARLSLDGTMRPLDPMPTYQLQGRFDSLNVGRFVEGQTSNLAGTFRLKGQGFDPYQAGLTATLDLAPSRFNRYRVQEGRLTASLGDTTVNLRAQLSFPEGLVETTGTLLLNAPLRYRIEEGRFENLDLAALLGDTTRSTLTGTFSLTGSGTDPATDLRLDDLQVSLSNSVYGPYTIFAATLRSTLRRGTLDLEAEADLDGGAFDLAGTARPFDRVPTYALTRGRFADVDLGRLTQNPNQRSTLTGTLDLDGRGFETDAMTLNARLHLDPSQFNEQTVDSARVTLGLEQGRLAFTARLNTPRGTTTLTGTGTPFAEDPAFALQESNLNHLNLGALLGVPYLDSDLNGTVRALNVRGSTPQTMTLTADLDLATSRLNNEIITEGQARIELDNGFVRARADLALEQGTIRLDSLTGRLFDERPTYTAAGALANVDLAQLSGLDTLQLSLSADFAVEGEGFDPATMHLPGAQLNVRDARYYEVDVRTLQARFSLNHGLIDIDTLYARSNVADVSGGGPLALFDTTGTYGSDFAVEGTLRDEQPLRPFLNVETFSVSDGAFQGRVSGAADTLRFEVRAQVNSLAYDDLRVLGMDAQAAGRLNRDWVPTVAEVRAELSQFSTPTLSVRYSEFETAIDGDDLAFSAGFTIDRRRDARLRGRADLREDSRGITLEELSMHFDDDRWDLLQEASITYGDEYRISNLLLVEENQEIAIDGVIDFDGDQSLVLTILDFRIGAIADLFRMPGLDGTLNGDLVLGGPATSPTVEGTLDLDIEAFTNPVGTLHVGVDYDSLTLNVEATLTHRDNSTMALHGYLPLDLRLSQGRTTPAGAGLRLDRQPSDLQSDVSLRLDAARFNIGWVEPFLDPQTVNEVEGKLTADVGISGTLDDPVLTGEARFAEGRLGLPELGLVYRRIQGDVEFSNDQVLVNHVEVQSGNGKIIGHGTVDLPQLTFGEFNLTASVEDFLAIDTREYRAVASGDLDLRGTTSAPNLTGTVELLSADIYLTEETSADEFGPVTLTEEDLQMLERHFGIRVTEADTTTFDFYEALAMDLTVEMGRDVWLRSSKNPEMNIQFTGDLELTKQAYRDQQLFGTIEVIPQRSFIKQFGRRFNISEEQAQTNTLTFNGPATEPQMDLAAEYEVRSRRSQDTEITIILEVKGLLDDPDLLKLRSDPETDITNIVSYIATGRPANQAFQLGGGSALDAGAALAFGQLTGIIENAAGTELGLDVIEIQQEDAFRGATITAGKYLSRRLYTSVSWPISFGSGSSQSTTTTTNSNRQVLIEYELFNWLLARITSVGTTIRFNLLFEYAY